MTNIFQRGSNHQPDIVNHVESLWVCYVHLCAMISLWIDYNDHLRITDSKQIINLMYWWSGDCLALFKMCHECKYQGVVYHELDDEKPDLPRAFSELTYCWVLRSGYVCPVRCRMIGPVYNDCILLVISMPKHAWSNISLETVDNYHLTN